jgi:hypothetical protein
LPVILQSPTQKRVFREVFLNYMFGDMGIDERRILQRHRWENDTEVDL